MPAGAYDRPAGEIKILIAGKRLLREIGEVFLRRDERHELENRARRKCPSRAAVDEKTVDARVGLAVRVVGRGGDHSQDLAGLIVHHEYCAAPPRKRIPCSGL